MPEIITIRQSAISLFGECRRHWKYAYLDNLEADYGAGQRPWRTADLGTLVHLGVQTYYDGGDWPRIELAMRAWVLEHFPEDDPDVTKGLKMALVMMEGHINDLAETGADRGETTIWTEKQLAVELPSVYGEGQHKVVVTGKPDRLLEHEQYGIILEDTKTVSKLEDTLQFAEQLFRYCILLRIDDNTRCARVRTNQLKKVLRTKGGPFFARPFLPITDAVYNQAWGNLDARIQDMVRVIECLDFDPFRAYPAPGTYCSWKCAFEAPCQAQNDGGYPDQILELHYRERKA